MNSPIIFLFFTVAICIQFQVSNCAVGFYTAAVMEYSPPPKSDTEENLKYYEIFTAQAAEKGADIIVFPEGGLTNTVISVVPDPMNKISPCVSKDGYSEVLKNLSCTAQNFNIYMVVNLPEKREIIHSNGSKVTAKYNSNVVFDRRGVVVARYAKYNLFDEILTNKPVRPELSFFDTDFNVRFGTFICFDILFQEPALRLVKQYEIKNFVFSNQWFSELPFLTALQVQRGWSEAYDVNLLASGYNNPARGSTGSGIFLGSNGSIIHYMGDVRGSKLLVAKVPIKSRDLSYVPMLNDEQSNAYSNYESKIETALTLDKFDLRSDQIDLFESQVIETDSDYSSTVCSHNNFCCQFKIRVNVVGKNPKGYNYRAVAFNGVRRFGLLTTGGVQVCGVIFCDGPKISNCTRRAVDLKGIHEFQKIQIEAGFRLKNSLQIPTTLTGGEVLETLPPQKYEFQTEEIPAERVRKVTMNLDWPTDDLMTFAVWGRDFTRDGQRPSPPVSGAPSFSSFFSKILASLAFVFLRN